MFESTVLNVNKFYNYHDIILRIMSQIIQYDNYFLYKYLSHQTVQVNQK